MNFILKAEKFWSPEGLNLYLIARLPFTYDYISQLEKGNWYSKTRSYSSI